MPMARNQNRDTDEQQRSDQTATPPAVLQHQLLLEPIKSPADVVFVPAATCGFGFFGHTSSCVSRRASFGRLTSSV
jgi:hypothetical protein